VYNHKTSFESIAWRTIFGIQKSPTLQRQAFLFLKEFQHPVAVVGAGRAVRPAGDVTFCFSRKCAAASRFYIIRRNKMISV